MDLGLNGKTALVTAASQGIGLAVAEGLAAEGVRVALCARTPGAAERAAAAIGGGAAGFVADVSRQGDIDRLFDDVQASVGAPDILVVNAGGPPAGTPSELGVSGWDEAFQLTLMSAVRLAQGALPAMRRRGWGRVVNVTSLSVREPIPTLTLSNAFRAAVTGYAKTLAGEVARDGVTVNSVAPGYTATAHVEEVFGEEARRRLEADIPAGRFARPGKIAAAAVFLASAGAGYITGQTLLVDGGLTKGGVLGACGEWLVEGCQLFRRLNLSDRAVLIGDSSVTVVFQCFRLSLLQQTWLRADAGSAERTRVVQQSVERLSVL